MYIPAHFAETRIDVLHQLIQAHPLGALVTLEPQGLNANHLPFLISPPSAGAPCGTLRAHIARSNPLWQKQDPSSEALVIFQGAQTYISPNWYEEKQRSGKVVPTYNYAVVHAHGRLRIMDDAAWLLGLLQELTARHEADQPAPWQLSDAPPDYVEKLLAAIVGIEIPLTRLEGKWKVSQNRPTGDQSKIAAGLRASATPDALAMAALVAAAAPRDTCA